MNTPSVGRIVHFHSHRAGPALPALIVSVCGPELVNLQVVLDGTNSTLDMTSGFNRVEAERGLAWRTSVHLAENGSDGPHWRWPPRT